MSELQERIAAYSVFEEELLEEREMERIYEVLERAYLRGSNGRATNAAKRHLTFTALGLREADVLMVETA